MTPAKKKKTWWQILLITLGCLLLFIGLFLFGARLYFRLPVSDYYKASEKTFVIPGIKDGFVAQGLAYDNDQFYVTGYMKNGSASPIYIVDQASGKLTQTVYMYTSDNEPYHGHCGGIAVYGNYIYVAAGEGLCVFDRVAVDTAQFGSDVPYLGIFSTVADNMDYVGVACVSTFGNKLLVGEFYRAEVYPTPDNHKITTPVGDYNQALGMVYSFSDEEDAIYGINPEPEMLYSLPDQVQGLNYVNGKIFCSTSWGTASSHILEYDADKVLIGSISFMDRQLPIAYLDSSCLLHDYKIAPMSEELVFLKDKMYTMCESASNKYIFGKFTSAKWCYATDLKKLGN